jgi:hypothetical protein
MHRVRFIFGAALMLAAANVRAATTTPFVIDNTDFTLQNRAQAPIEWQTNGTAGLQLDPSGENPITLALTHNQNGENGTAFTLIKGSVPSFTMWADVNITFDLKTPKDCPADGFTMVFTDAAPNFAPGGGGSLGVYDMSAKVTPDIFGFEVNLWHSNALEDTADCTMNKFTTVAFNDFNSKTGYTRDVAPAKVGTADAGGARIAQADPPAAVTILNGGWYRYQWNVDAVNGTMAAYITGLDASNKSAQNVPLTSVTLGKNAPSLNFSGRWGIAAATGGAHCGVQVAHVEIITPMQTPGSPVAGQ